MSVDSEGYDLVIVLFAGVSVCCSFVFEFGFGFDSFSTNIKENNRGLLFFKDWLLTGAAFRKPL